MRYRIESSDPVRPVLRFSMPERPFVVVFLAVTATVCLLLGLAYAVADTPEPGDALRAVSLTGFGLFALCAIFLFRSGLVFPSRLVFDNALGWMTMRGTRGTTEGAVPYAGIAGFAVRRAVTETVAGWSVGIDMKRGGRWELYRSRRKGRAEAFAANLAELVNLAAVPGERPEVQDDLAASAASGRLVRWEWKRKTRPATMIVAIAAVASFVAACFAVRPFANGPAGYAVAAGFGALLVVAAATGIARTAGERVVVEAGPTAITWRKRSALTRERAFFAALGDVAAVDLSFTFARAETAISLLRPSEVDQFVRYRQGTFGPGDVPGMVRFLRGLRRIDVSALSPGRRFSLAEELRERAGG